MISDPDSAYKNRDAKRLLYNNQDIAGVVSIHDCLKDVPGIDQGYHLVAEYISWAGRSSLIAVVEYRNTKG
jgi:hypothetical protein